VIACAADGLVINRGDVSEAFLVGAAGHKRKFG